MARAVALLTTVVLAAVACRDTPTAPTAEELALARVRNVGVFLPNGSQILLGASEQLTAKAFDSSGVEIATPLPFEWSVDDSSVVGVEPNGRITARKAGWTLIYARVATGVSGSQSLNVFDPGNKLALNPDSSRMLPGQRRKLGLQYLTIPGTVPAHGWSSSNVAVAMVDDDGVVTAVAPGVATVSVAHAGTTYQSEVRVVDIATPLRFTTVASGHYANCALAVDGAAYCWGTSRGGLLGSTEPMDRCIRYYPYTIPIGGGGPGSGWARSVTECAMEPVRVATPLRFASLDVQYSSGLSAACGTTSTGEAHCWGATGDLTGGSTDPTVIPVSAQLRFTSFSFPCGVTASNDAWCFGNPALRGAPASASSTPTQVTGAGIWRMVTGGLSATTHRCGVTTSGTVSCWGNNTGGKLGTGDTTASVIPVPVQSTERFSSVAVRNANSCALTLDQRLYCWGGGRATPTLVSTTLRFAALSMSEFGFCALGTDAVPYCQNSNGAMVNTSPGVLFRSMSSGPVHQCGIRQDGIAACWNDNSSGQLGTGDLIGRGTPVPVVGQ